MTIGQPNKRCEINKGEMREDTAGLKGRKK
jgi:hypothetical protein